MLKLSNTFIVKGHDLVERVCTIPMVVGIGGIGKTALAFMEQFGTGSLLRKLWIEDCPQIAFLLDGMSYLATMEECHITNCPKMIRRCQRETGVDWYKISHVRDICQKALMSTIQSTIACLVALYTYAQFHKLASLAAFEYDSVHRPQPRDLSPRCKQMK
ncbi:hypothetical protein LguiA_008473 [Lonicera macranthoides]